MMRTIRVALLAVLAMVAACFAPVARASAVASATIAVPADHATIQAAIDAASPGDDILVAPGTYVGGIDFGGKDVAVVASGGPSLTTIDGDGGTGVDLGPGGRLEGFTVTGSIASFGAGMAVHGLGSEIVGNVFDANAQGSGGFGAAIGGNSASPLIEGNRFVGNTCDGQAFSSVVAFVNSSSPRIVNNVFHDNPCRAIALTLPKGNAPVVQNNTIVRNRSGVRIYRNVDTSSQVYRNNLIVSNDIGVEVHLGTAANDPTFKSNLVYDNGVDYEGTDFTGIDGNLSADPRMVDAGVGLFALHATSPAVDAGMDLGAPPFDFVGTLRPLAGSLAGTLHVDIGAFEYVPCGNRFVDVDERSPFCADVAWMADRGLAEGFDDSTFRPSEWVSRQALTAFMYRLAGTPPGPFPPPPFGDVAPSDPFYDEISWASFAAVAGGHHDGTFRPGAPMSRQALIAFVYRLAGSPPGPFPAPSFSDVAPGHPFFVAISWAESTGVTTGYADGTFRPAATTSRQALAAFLWRRSQ